MNMPIINSTQLDKQCPQCNGPSYLTNEHGQNNRYCGWCGASLDGESISTTDIEGSCLEDDCRLDKNQRYFPEKGYTGPIETKEKCPNPAFYNEYKHRVGHFIVGTYDDGYQIQNKCVNCGKKFGRIWFMSVRRKDDRE